MLLAFLALMVLVAVVGQLSVSSSVERSIALNALEETRFEYAARGAYHEACALLIKDLKDEAQNAQDQGTGLGGTSDAFGGGVGRGGPDDQQGRQEGIPTDSLADEWADPNPSQGGGGAGEDLDVRIRVVDEDRKMNILCLVAKDDSFRELWKERMVRLLDIFREDTKYDLSAGEARDLVEGIEKWLRGERARDFPIPVQATSAAAAEDDKMVWSKSRFADEPEQEVVYPLTLDELVAVEGMSESLLHGFVENGRYVPGLEDVLTVYTNLRIDPDALEGEEEDDPLGDSPFDTGAAEQTEAEEAADQMPDDENQVETNQGRVNVNTAPLPVLAALMEEDRIPFSVIEKIDEFRRQATEVADAGERDFGLGESKKRSLSEEAEEQDEDFVFDDPDAVIDRVEDWFDTKLNVGEQERKDFGDALAVKSHVFSIFVELRRQRGGGRSFGDERPPDRVYRAVVWRRQQGEGKFQVLPLLPLSPYYGAVPPDSEEYREEFPFGF